LLCHYLTVSQNYPAIGKDLPIPSTPKDLIADSVKRSTIAHLFHFFPVLCEISSIPRKSPSLWILNSDAHSPWRGKGDEKQVVNGVEKAIDREMTAVEQDARALAKECLKEVGREMGVSR